MQTERNERLLWWHCDYVGLSDEKWQHSAGVIKQFNLLQSNLVYE